MAFPEQFAADTFNGSKAVGITEVQVSASSQNIKRGVKVKAAADNTNKVYVATATGVTANTAEATDGFELSAGEEVFLPVGDLNKVYAIAGAASQKIFYLAY